MMRSDYEIAASKRDRYRRDPQHRLAKINAARRKNGRPEAQSLDECQLHRRVNEETRYRSEAQ